MKALTDKHTNLTAQAEKIMLLAQKSANIHSNYYEMLKCLIDIQGYEQEILQKYKGEKLIEINTLFNRIEKVINKATINQ